MFLNKRTMNLYQCNPPVFCLVPINALNQQHFLNFNNGFSSYYGYNAYQQPNYEAYNIGTTARSSRRRSNARRRRAKATMRTTRRAKITRSRRATATTTTTTTKVKKCARRVANRSCTRR